jgi:hypothetical protein
MPFLVSVEELDPVEVEVVAGSVDVEVEVVAAGSLVVEDEGEDELPHPATPSATSTKPSASHLREKLVAPAADVLLNMRPPWYLVVAAGKRSGRRKLPMRMDASPSRRRRLQKLSGRFDSAAASHGQTISSRGRAPRTPNMKGTR